MPSPYSTSSQYSKLTQKYILGVVNPTKEWIQGSDLVKVEVQDILPKHLKPQLHVRSSCVLDFKEFTNCNIGYEGYRDVS